MALFTRIPEKERKLRDTFIAALVDVAKFVRNSYRRAKALRYGGLRLLRRRPQQRVTHFYQSKSLDQRQAVRNILLSLVEISDSAGDATPVSRAARRPVVPLI
jgi:hypothetical protein